jgi:hypothetical protein
MTEQATILHVPAGLGIDQSVREEHVQPGTANLYQENVRVTTQGSLIKCPGYTAQSTTSLGPGSPPSISAGLRVAPYKGSIVMSDGAILSSFDRTSGKWVPKARLPECSATSTAVTAAMTDGERVRIVYSSGYYVIASLDADGTDTSASYFVSARVIDQASKKVIATFVVTDASSPTLLDIRVVVVGGLVAFLWTDTGHVYGKVLNLATPTTLGAKVDILSDTNSTVFDAVALSDRIAIAYENSGGGTTRITVKTLNSTTLAVLNSSTQVTASNAIESLAIAGLEEIWLAWTYTTFDHKLWVALRKTSDTTSLAAATAAIDFSGKSTAAVIDSAVAGRTGISQVYVGARGLEDNSFISYSRVLQLTNVAGSITPGHATTYIGGWLPICKPFAVNGRVYTECSFFTVGAFDVALGDITSDASTSGFDRNQTVRPVGWVSPRACITAGDRAAVVSSTLVATIQLVTVSGSTASFNIVEYDFASQTRQLPVPFAGALHFSGGLHYAFDGERCMEAGFISPPILTAAAGSSTGLTGTFIYTAIHEFCDGAGNVIWSRTATTVTVTAANKDIKVYVQRPSLTWMEGFDPLPYLSPQGESRTRTKIYRTVNGGGVFYLLATFQTNPLSGVQLFDDTTSDASLIGNVQLYRDPGIVGTEKDRQAWGACLQMVECNGVLVAAMEDGTTLRCTAQRTVGEAPWHHDVLQIPIEGDGSITGLASMDGSVIVFKRDAIFIVSVDPANDNVTTGGFGDPKRLALNAGCIDPRSIVVTSMGVFYQSDLGIMLLTRQLDVQFLGKKIQKTFASYPNVVSAAVDERGGLVRFCLAQNGSSTVGVDAVFDMVLEVWVSFDAKTSSAGQANRQAVSSAYCNSSSGYRYTWLDASGVVYQESTSFLAADGSFVSSKWETPRLKTELQREHQMWQGVVMFDRNESAGLVAEVAYDFADYTETKTWTEADVTSFQQQVEARVTGRRQAVKFRFHDTAPAAPVTGQGLEFIGLSLDLAPHQGATQGTPKLDVGARR